MVLVEREITKYLRKFVNKNLISGNPTAEHTNKKNLSSTSITFLHKIYKEIEMYDMSWNDVFHNKITVSKLDYNEINKIISLKKCKHIYQNSNEDAESFEKPAVHTIAFKYTFTISSQPDKNICVYFILPLHPDEIHMADSKKIEDFFTECIRRVYIWLCICYKHTRENCSDNLSVYIYMSDHYKLLPETKEEVIHWIHANTAFTTSCVKNAEIMVCRQEEWYKCFIHETFHCMGLDFSSYPNQYELSKKYIMEIFPLHNSPVLLFESYCEMNAEIINLIFYIYMNYSDTINKGNGKGNTKTTSQPMIFYKLFKEKLLYEQLFSIFQCVKVLHHYNIKYSDLHLSSLECVEKRQNYREETNILSYYILKSIYMYSLDDFLLWMLEHNGLSHTFQYNNTETNTFHFCQIIKRHYLDPEYLKHIDFMEKWWEVPKNNTIETRSLRMSLHEL